MLGLSEQYSSRGKGKMDGEFSLDDITKPSRGVHWQQQSQFAGGVSASADFDAVTFEDNTPSYRNTSLNLSRPLGAGTATMSLGTSSYNGSSDQSTTVGYRFNSLNLGAGILVTPSWNVQDYRRDAVAQALVIDPRTGEPLAFNNTSGRSTTTGLDLGVNFRERNLGPLRLTGSISSGYSWALPTMLGASQFSTQWTLDHLSARPATPASPSAIR